MKKFILIATHTKKKHETNYLTFEEFIDLKNEIYKTGNFNGDAYLPLPEWEDGE